jgi:hypothetical protein
VHRPIQVDQNFQPGSQQPAWMLVDGVTSSFVHAVLARFLSLPTVRLEEFEFSSVSVLLEVCNTGCTALHQFKAIRISSLAVSLSASK